MAKLVTTAGSQIAIGDEPMEFTGTDMTVSDFDSVDWTDIKGHTDLGALGDTAELVSSNQINVSRTRKAKGVRNAGSKVLLMDVDYSDPGQLALVAAEKTSFTYPFKVVLNDAPPGGTPSERYFLALVMSAEEQFNDASQSVKLSTTLEVDSNIVRVAAAAGD